MATARTQQSDTDSRGRHASSPRSVSKRGWRDILLRVKDELGNDNVGLISAGVAFYFLLAVFPMITAFLSIYGLVLDPAEARSQLEGLADVLPSQAHELLTQQAAALAEGSGAGLGFGAALSILLALWGARQGTSAMTIALNIVYDEKDERSFIKRLLLSLGLTLGLILFFVAALAAIAAVPVILELVGLGSVAETAINILRWPALGLLAITALAIMYRVCPDRDSPKWRWLTPGAVLAVILWLLASALFSLYVSSFGSYNETYGSVAAVIVLLFWFYLSAYIFLIGAEINAEMEHQTVEDTTRGEPQPMGRRDAYVADDLGKRP